MDETGGLWRKWGMEYLWSLINTTTYIGFHVDGWDRWTVPEVEDGVLVVPQHTSRMIDRFERHKRHSYACEETENSEILLIGAPPQEKKCGVQKLTVSRVDIFFDSMKYESINIFL